MKANTTPKQAAKILARAFADATVDSLNMVGALELSSAAEEITFFLIREQIAELNAGKPASAVQITDDWGHLVELETPIEFPAELIAAVNAKVAAVGGIEEISPLADFE